MIAVISKQLFFFSLTYKNTQVPLSAHGYLFSIASVAGLRPATLLKKRLWHRCFPVNFFEISKNTFFTEHFRITTSAFCNIKTAKTSYSKKDIFRSAP